MTTRKKPHHYIDHLKIALLVLLRCNSDVGLSFPI